MAVSEIVKRFVSCLHPRRVFNPSLGEYIVTPCGHCKQCLNSKAFIQKKACESEGKSHRYVFFVNPDYNEDSMPSCRYEYLNEVDGEKFYTLFDDCVRSDTYGQEIMVLAEKELNFTLKTRYNPFKHYQSKIGYALPKDLQNYIKRIRDQISRDTGEKIRYFAVSDYGGKFARPHFHILFYFDEYKTFKIFRKVCRKKWQFGRVNCSPAKDGAAAYVSHYVTGVSTTLNILEHPFFRPRSFHSNHFGFEALKSYKEDIFKNASSCFRGECYGLLKGFTEFYGTSSIERAFFPRCFRFNQLPFDGLYRIYTLYYELTQGVARCFEDWCFMLFDKMLHDSYFKESMGLWLDVDPKVVSPFEDIPDDVLSRLQGVYSLGRKFYGFICNHDPSLFRSRLISILDYYQGKAQWQLSKFYTTIEQDNGLVLSIDDYDYLYPHSFCDEESQWSNFIANLSLTHCYEQALYESTKIFNERLKHREHSDILITKKNNYVKHFSCSESDK
ncbi:replication initiator protein [Peromfec virus RodF8_8]|uniref:Replication initiator protein n=1 Tax=Peromfec virus RodF8_8 TaxID=2929389 RepID=A0A976N206_9VIRU|nr:replication initiator protein [Peromfec virus RodF8_8]